MNTQKQYTKDELQAIEKIEMDKATGPLFWAAVLVLGLPTLDYVLTKYSPLYVDLFAQYGIYFWGALAASVIGAFLFSKDFK